MQIKDKVVLVTGANRGLGLQFVKGLLAAGAKKVYAGARNPAKIDLPGVESFRLDVTDAASVAAAAERFKDVDIVINNAGAITPADAIDANAATALRELLEVNTIGLLSVSQAFAPTLKQNGGGALVNILSVLSWLTIPHSAAYSASKSAAWALTNGLRQDLSAQDTLVVGVHPGYIDTDMTAGIDAPKTTTEQVVQQVLEGIEAGKTEVLVDDTGRQVKQSLSTAQAAYLFAYAG